MVDTNLGADVNNSSHLVKSTLICCTTGTTRASVIGNGHLLRKTSCHLLRPSPALVLDSLRKS